MGLIDIKVPNIGDFKDVEIIEILVKDGQNISKGDSIITLESDKSSVEVPSDHSGKISNISVRVGDKVSEGDLILKIESSEKENVKNNKKEISTFKESSKSNEKIQESSEIRSSIQTITTTNKSVLASPKVRKFARELGTDLNKIPGSEKFGRVTEEDVKSFIKLGLNQKKIIKEKDQNLKI